MKRRLIVALVVAGGCGTIREVPVGGTDTSGGSTRGTGSGTGTAGTCTDCDHPTGSTMASTSGSTAGGGTSTPTGGASTGGGDRTLLCADDIADPTIASGELDVPLTVADGGSIVDLDVPVRLFHTAPGELEIRLRRDPHDLQLMPRPSTLACGEGLSLVFDDAADLSATEVCAHTDQDVLTVAPADALGVLSGEDVAGTWTLAVIDHGDAGSGTLDRFCLSAVLGPG